MIPFDFDYFRPASLQEAITLFQQLEQRGKQPIYYAGGTEIISFARVHSLYTEAVIDIKDIPECRVYQKHNGMLVTGACLTLTQISETPFFPLLSETVLDAADHTNRNKITLGGIINSQIIYREAVLPFLLADSQVILASEKGIRSTQINNIFDKKLQLQKGELLVQIFTDVSYLQAPFVTIKKTKLEKVDYPLVRVAALQKDKEIRIAFSGVCAFPFRSQSIEAVINDQSMDIHAKVKRVIQLLPGPILNDIRGSADYREFVLQHTLYQTLEKFEGVRL